MSARLESMTHPQITAAYKDVFVNSESGKTVLADLIRQARSTKIAANEPNPNSAVYRCAQEDLIDYILSRLERTDARIVAGNAGSASRF